MTPLALLALFTVAADVKEPVGGTMEVAADGRTGGRRGQPGADAEAGADGVRAGVSPGHPDETGPEPVTTGTTGERGNQEAFFSTPLVPGSS